MDLFIILFLARKILRKTFLKKLVKREIFYLNIIIRTFDLQWILVGNLISFIKNHPDETATILGFESLFDLKCHQHLYP